MMLNPVMLAKVAPYIAIAVLLGLSVLFFANWQQARENVGYWKHTAEVADNNRKVMKAQLTVANDRITQTSKAGAVSYGHCQDLVTNDATKNFDLGVLFGRNTCPAITSPASPASRVQ